MSVCIFHRDGWIATDSRCHLANGNISTWPTKKAFVCDGGHSAVCLVGDAIVGQLLIEALDGAALSEPVINAISGLLADHPEHDSFTGVVNTSRQLFLVDSVGHREEITGTDYWAIGCADNFVRGYLGYIETVLKRPITVEDAGDAIRLAAKTDTGIDDRVQVVRVG